MESEISVDIPSEIPPVILLIAPPRIPSVVPVGNPPDIPPGIPSGIILETSPGIPPRIAKGNLTEFHQDFSRFSTRDAF